MPTFDPTKPANGEPMVAGEVRDNFGALKALIDSGGAPTTLQCGTGQLNDGGVLIIGAPGARVIIAGWQDTPGTGVLYNNTFSSIQSSAGAADAGLTVNWIAF